MKINTDDIFDRMDLQQIRHFILYGVAPSDTYNLTYEQFLTEGSILISDRLKSLYKDNEIELTNATDELHTALTVNSEIFTEIGMKAGARLLFQLLGKDD